MSAKLYVGSYAKYNNGSIAGAWLELNDYGDADEFLEACAELHNDEEDCELMFQDYDGFPQELYSESLSLSDIELIYNYLDVFNQLDDSDERTAFEIWMNLYSMDADLDAFRDSYAGKWDSEEEFAEQFFDDVYLHDVPESIRYYIDYSRFARDLFINDYSFDDGYVFCNR